MVNKKVRTREEMDPKYQWDLTPMFENDQAFEAEYAQVEQDIEKIKVYQGRLHESGEILAEAFDQFLALNRVVLHLGIYAHLRSDQDQGNSFYQNMNAKCGQLYSKFSQNSSFLRPELLQIPSDQLDSMIESNERLQSLRQYIDNLVRFREHTLSSEQELLLAHGTEVFNSASETFSFLTNADMVFPTMEDEEGNEVAITHSSFGKLLESSDRRVRKEVFDKYYQVFEQFNNTLAQTLSTQIKIDNYFAKVYNYPSARNAALFANNIPEDVYDTLLEAVGDRLDLLHRYVELRKDQLNLDQLEMYDMYTPLLGEPAIKFTYEEAKDVTLKALAPMGEEYVAILEEAFNDAWIDVYENKGKRSGAYSSGSYDSKPYILMSWQDSLNSLYTLVHELGHSVHSYLTRKNQPYEYGRYSIFLAEIASTTNENLLTDYLLKTYDDVEIRKYIINNFLDGMKGTIFRQTQFAEFEHFMHQQDAAGQPLTGEFLCESYQELNAKYYGPAVNSDSDIRFEWSRIPHFYYNYYVFQYSTGFAAATFFANKILAKDEEARTRYLNFLKSGDSKYAIDTMKTAGLDMTQRAYIDETLDVFEERLTELEKLLKE